MDFDLKVMLGICYLLKNNDNLDLYRAPMWHAEYDFEKKDHINRILDTQVYK